MQLQGPGNSVAGSCGHWCSEDEGGETPRVELVS